MKNQTFNHIVSILKEKAISLFYNSLFFGFSKSSVAPTPVSMLTAGTGSEFRPPKECRNPESLPVAQTPSAFSSNFKLWIRAVAFVVVFVFLPEQVSSAFNYNPAVLWGRQKIDASVSAKKGATISSSIKDLLAQVAGKENPKVKIELPNSGVSGAAAEHSFVMTTKAKFTQDDVMSFEKWLKQANVHPLNCGVYALRDLLERNNVGIGLEEVSVLTLTVDILGRIIKPGEPRLKTSLYAIDSIASAYGLHFAAVKIAPEDIGSLSVPFIASLEPEHFVLVTEVGPDTITFNDIGQSKTFFKDQFLKKFTGYAFASNAQGMSKGEMVSDDKKAFIWGSQWAAPYEDLIQAQAVDQNKWLTNTLINVATLLIAMIGAISKATKVTKDTAKIVDDL